MTSETNQTLPQCAPGRKKAARAAKISEPGSRIPALKLALQHVQIDEIKGLDTDIEEFLESEDFSLQTCVDFKAWDEVTAKLIYSMAPMVLIQRKKQYEVLGSGRAWRAAQAIFGSTEPVPALVLTDAKRITRTTKLQFLSAELIGLHAEFRTRPHLPEALLKIWNRLNAEGIESIKGIQPKDFARGTGFTVRKPARDTNAGKVEA